ncbi:MAG: YfhO family protein [Eubacterium sp.]|nr:YfhO family protein [Eubacterium sp.]
MKSIKNKNNIKVYILAFSIPFIVALIGLIVGRFAPFGQKLTLIANKSDDYVTYYYNLYDSVKSGKGLIFNNSTGLGFDMTGLFTYKISDPTNLLILLFSRQAIPTVLNLLYLFKVSFAGLAMSIFLLNRPSKLKKDIIDSEIEDKKVDNKKKDIVLGFKGEPKSIIGRLLWDTNWFAIGISIAYALSITMLTVGMNIAYTSAIAILPLIILGIDKIIDSQKPTLFIISFTLSIFFNLHISMITGLFVLLYFLTRDFETSKDFLIKLRTFIISGIISLLCGGVILFNSIGSGFLSDDLSLTFPVFNFINPLNLVNELMTKNTLTYYSLYYNYMDIFFGVGFLFFIVMFLFLPDRKINTKIKNILLFLFIFLGSATSTFRHLFNGLSTSAGTSVHYGYIIVFLGLLISYDVLSNISIIKTKRVCFAGFITISIIISAMVFSTSYDKFSSYIISLEFIFGYFMLTLVYSSKSFTKSLYKLLIFALILFEITPNYISNIKTIGTYFVSQDLLENKKYQAFEASKLIHKDDPSARILFYDAGSNKDTPFTFSVSGYDYIISSKKIAVSSLEELDFYSPDQTKSGVYIYKNKYSLAYALYDSSIKEYVYDERTPFSSANIFTDTYLNEGNVFDIGESEVGYMESYDGSTLSYQITPYILGDLYFKAYAVTPLGIIDSNDPVFANQTSQKVQYPNQYTDYELGAFNEETLKKVYEKCNMTQSNFYNNRIKIQSESDGYLALGIAKIPTFNYYVNGEKVEPLSLTNDMAMVPIICGTNTIEVTYNPTYLIIGLLFTCFGLILLVVYIKRKQTVKEGKYINIIANHIDRNYVYYVVFATITVLFILCTMVTSSYPFGPNPAITGDGLSQTYTFSINQFTNAKAGKLFPYVIYDIGGFSEVYHTFLYDLLNPWIFLKLKFLPEFLYIIDFTMKYFLSLLLPAFSIIYYLTHKEKNRLTKSDKRLIPLAFMYSIGSYAAIFFPYEGLRYTAFLPLIILGVERLVYHNKKALYITLLFSFMVYDTYHSFLLCEFLALYFFTLHFVSFKDFVVKGLRFAMSSIVAAGLAAFSLYSFFVFSQNSTYITQNDIHLSLTKSFKNFLSFLSDYRLGNVFSSISTESSNAAIYSGIILLFVIPLYLMCKKVSLWERVSVTALIIVLYVSFNNELLNYVFHGFHVQSLVPNRYAIFFVFLMISILANIMVHTNEYNASQIQLTIISVSFIFILLYIANKGISTISLVLSIGFILIYLALIIISAVKKSSNDRIIKNMLIITSIEIIINFVIVFPNQIHGTSDIIQKAEIINHISDAVPETKSFYTNTEYLGEHPLDGNIGLISDINTMSYFSSSYTADMNYRTVFYNISSSYNFFDYRGGNPLADMMFDIRYHVEDTYDESSYSPYKKIYSYNNFNLYENPNFLSLGVVIPENEDINKIDVTTIEGNEAFEYQNSIVNALGGKDIYERIECTPINEGDEYSPDKSVFYTGENYEYNEINSTKNEYVPIYIRLSDKIEGNIYVSIGGTIYCIGKVDKDNHTLMVDYNIDQVDKEDFSPSIAVYNENNLKELHDKLSENMMKDITEDGRTINGTVNSAISGTLYISLPYYEAWQIYIDNKPVEKSRFMGGIGVPITAGNHSIRMEYRPQGAIIGIVISISTLVLIIAYSLFERLRKKNNK